MNLVIVNTHPIQYFAPLYRLLPPLLTGRLTVLYCSRRGLDVAADEGFGERFRWTVDLLEGYDHLFLPEARENAQRPTEAIRCDSLARELDALAPDLLVVHGYADPSARAALRWARRTETKVLMRGDTWSGAGETSGRVRARLKRLWLRGRVLPGVAGYLAVGQRNRAYWRELGASEAQIAVVPYGVDKARFAPAEGAAAREATRRAFGLDQGSPVLGFVGKFIEKKGLVQLLESVAGRAGTWTRPPRLLLAGAGPLRNRIEGAAARLGWPATFLGFRNQDELPDVYRACDAVLMPSLKGETWGFTVQEALACGVQVMASSTVGCAPDLLRDGENGWVLPSGDWPAWAAFLTRWTSAAISPWDKSAAETIARTAPGFDASAAAYAAAVERFS